MRHKNFVALILTHGRPESVYTYTSLLRSGYTGPIVIVIDNEDKEREAYKRKFGNRVYVFDKKAVSDTFDEGDNFGDRRTIVYARNAAFQIAKELGFKFFIELDDDYTDFRYKRDENLNYEDMRRILSLDTILDAMLDYFEAIPAKSIAVAQGGDFIGGSEGTNARRMRTLRKCMNTFICSVDRPFKFVGRINEDVNTYALGGLRGDLFLTILNVAIQQRQTQSNAGGMTDVYLNSGTYVKSFYSVMYAPSCVCIHTISSVHTRLHHMVNWNNCAAKIVPESVRKA